MKYWIIIDDNRLGPLTVDEIRMTPGACLDTPVWHQGLSAWTTIAMVPELASLFAPPVPEFNTGRQDARWTASYSAPKPQPVPAEPPTYLIWNILATVLCCIPSGILGIYFSAKVSSKYSRGDYHGARVMSERAQWMVMLSIVLGLISLPFQMVIAMF
ncbi:MAG: CD225/dispanin family protein [Muribaculaceae bacterium]|nr:CD225/dispanin family protein [Muribaculaceae bacterium]